MRFLVFLYTGLLWGMAIAEKAKLGIQEKNTPKDPNQITVADVKCINTARDTHQWTGPKGKMCCKLPVFPHQFSNRCVAHGRYRPECKDIRHVACCLQAKNRSTLRRSLYDATPVITTEYCHPAIVEFLSTEKDERYGEYEDADWNEDGSRRQSGGGGANDGNGNGNGHNGRGKTAEEGSAEREKTRKRKGETGSGATGQERVRLPNTQPEPVPVQGGGVLGVNLLEPWVQRNSQ